MGRFAMYRRRGTATNVAPEPDTAITSADLFDVDAVIFFFDRAIVVPPANWADFEVDGNAAIAVLTGGVPPENFVSLQYSVAVAGLPWQVVSQPPGIQFTGGHELLIPQSGTVPT